MREPLVIIGSGLAGYTLAREWRKLDAITPLVVISRDGGAFYSKPMLSNALASGRTAASLINRSAAQMASDLQAEVLTHTQVESIDVQQRTLTLSRGAPQGSDRAAGGQAASTQTLRYARLVLALGADPIALPIGGQAADRIHRVNDLGDYAAFADGIEGARRVAILGAGLIGCEFANDLLSRGIEPVVIDPAPWPLGRLLPEDAGRFLRSRLEAAGVSFIFNAAAERVDPAAAGGLALTLSDGSRVLADAVLSAVGLRPRTGLAQAAGLLTRRGIRVDRLLSTSVPGIFALGDCIELEQAGTSLVLPFVMPLMQQARALAATLAGPTTALTYPAMPVTVKTPACPTVVCPPPSTTAVHWETDIAQTGCTALARNAEGDLVGWALLGSATTRRQELTRAVPALLA